MKKTILLLIAFTVQFGISNAQWQQTSLDTTNVLCFAADGTNIFAGTSNNGIYLSTDNGINWTTVNNGVPYDSILSSLYSISTLAIKGTNIFAGDNYDAGIILSTNNGGNWTTANNGLTFTSINTLMVSGNNIYVGETGVDISTNNGNNWTPLGLTNMSVWSLAINGTNIFAGTYGHGIYLSTNNGANWTAVNNGIPTPYPVCVTTMAIKGTNIFAGTFGNCYGVLKSTNNGANWTEANNGLPYNTSSSNYYDVNSFLVIGMTIFMVYDDEVYLSTNNGMNWTSANAGIPTNNLVQSLTVNGMYIFAGTYQHGVWRRPLSDFTGIIEINENDGLSVLPNPAIANITIKIPDHAVIEISNFQGRLIKRIKATKNQTTIDISDLARGMYFIKVTTEKGVITKKFIKE